MWLATTRGFYSAVQGADGRLVVRARARADLKALLDLLPARTQIEATPSRDYPYRLSVTPEAWQKALAALAGEVIYPNFKDAIHARDPERAGVYAGVWSRLLAIQHPHGLSAFDGKCADCREHLLNGEKSCPFCGGTRAAA